MATRPAQRTYVVESSRATSLEPATLMERLRDPKTWPRWQPEIDEVVGPSPLDQGDEVQGFAHMLGFGVQGRSDATVVTDTEFEEDVIVGVRMRVRYTVEAAGSAGAGAETKEPGSIVTRRLEVDLPRGLAGRVLSVLLKWRLKRMQERVLAELTRH